MCAGVARVESCPDEPESAPNPAGAAVEPPAPIIVKVKWMYEAKLPFEYLAPIYNAFTLADSAVEVLPFPPHPTKP